MLIVEEPDEGLDEDSKLQLDDTFARVFPGRTVLLLPGRMTTLRRADRVVLLHRGKVEAHGPREELVQNVPLYRHWEYVRFNHFRHETAPQPAGGPGRAAGSSVPGRDGRPRNRVAPQMGNKALENCRPKRTRFRRCWIRSPPPPPDATRFAAAAHAGQTRKGSGEPYVTHPLAVMTILCRTGWGHDVELLAAAALHDVLEDTAVTEAELTEMFPPRVVELVAALSERKRDDAGAKLPWETRKAEHRRRLSAAAPAVRALALADKLHNLRCLEADLAEGKEVWPLFNAPRERWLEVTGETVTALRCEETEPLANACDRILEVLGTATVREPAP